MLFLFIELFSIPYDIPVEISLSLSHASVYKISSMDVIQNTVTKLVPEPQHQTSFCKFVSVRYYKGHFIRLFVYNMIQYFNIWHLVGRFD